MKNQQVIILSLLLLAAVLFGARSHAQSKSMVLQQLQAWESMTQKRLDLDERENDLRRQFITRLIFQVERKYNDTSLKNFLQTTLLEMAETERQGRQFKNSTVVFLENLSEALDTQLEPRENPLAFLQAFTEYSGLSEPASSDDFAESRSYFDGRSTRPARPTSLEQAASAAEEFEKNQELQQLKSMDPFEAPWFDFHEDIRNDFIPPPDLEPAPISPLLTEA